jgi:acyl carrier protein
VLRIWQSVLPQRDISVEDDFFDLQADSLQAVQILARVKRRMNVELPVDFLFEKTFSIATIAEAVDLAILGAVDPDHLIAELQNINAMSDADIADQLQAEISSIGS